MIATVQLRLVQPIRAFADPSDGVGADGIGAEWRLDGGAGYGAAPERGRDARPQHDPELFAGTETVLLVDDEPAVRHSASRILGRFGYRVVVAEDGLDAIRILETEAERIHIVVTDMVMPRMDARDLIVVLRRRWPALPVVLSTGFDMGRLPENERHLFDRFVPKPYTPVELLRAVRATLDERLP
jgi:two-component system cell cycle sensor histidine kinase/response regulator CckA